jgi:hypothetical protein
LANRQSATALEELNALHQQFPDRLDIHAAALTVRTAVHASLWTPPSADAVSLLLANTERRLVRTNKELADLIAETLDRIERDLPSHGELLWDRQRQRRPTRSATTQAPPVDSSDTWLPKAEAALCAYLAHELQIRLRGQGLAINREVLVKPTDPYGAGDRTDILVEAVSDREHWSSNADNSTSRLAIVIEAKGNWNPGLENDLAGQLAGRYLPDVQTDTGIYLVGWFPVDQWTDASDKRRSAARKRDRASTHAVLEEEASRLHRQHVIVRTIHIPRPQPQE